MSNEVAGPATTTDTEPASSIQAAPEQGSGSELYQLVLKDFIERAEFGSRKYGHPLRTTAGINFLVNSYQELLDLVIYLRGEICRREKEEGICTCESHGMGKP